MDDLFWPEIEEHERSVPLDDLHRHLSRDWRYRWAYRWYTLVDWLRRVLEILRLGWRRPMP